MASTQAMKVAIWMAKFMVDLGYMEDEKVIFNSIQ
jgi:hypothetical protein